MIGSRLPLPSRTAGVGSQAAQFQVTGCEQAIQQSAHTH
jgi:hypothetical protein